MPISGRKGQDGSAVGCAAWLSTNNHGGSILFRVADMFPPGEEHVAGRLFAIAGACFRWKKSVRCGLWTIVANLFSSPFTGSKRDRKMTAHPLLEIAFLGAQSASLGTSLASSFGEPSRGTTHSCRQVAPRGHELGHRLGTDSSQANWRARRGELLRLQADRLAQRRTPTRPARGQRIPASAVVKDLRCFGNRSGAKNWCARRDSNPRPLPSEGSTLSS